MRITYNTSTLYTDLTTSAAGYNLGKHCPILTSCRRAVATICPRSSPPSVGAEAPRAAEPTAPDRNVAVGSHSEYFPTVTATAA